MQARGNRVCSGCSGEYAGGFDDPGERAADGDGANSLIGNCGEPDGQRSQPPSEKTRGFETKMRRGNGQAIARGLSDESVADVWEILVSGTQIVEIRMIAANDCELKELRGVGACARRPARQQSTTASAKYYEARRARAKDSGDRVQTAWYRGIGGAVAAELNRWLQWARQSLAISHAKNSA